MGGASLADPQESRGRLRAPQRRPQGRKQTWARGCKHRPGSVLETQARSCPRFDSGGLGSGIPFLT